MGRMQLFDNCLLYFSCFISQYHQWLAIESNIKVHVMSEDVSCKQGGGHLQISGPNMLIQPQLFFFMYVKSDYKTKSIDSSPKSKMSYLCKLICMIVCISCLKENSTTFHVDVQSLLMVIEKGEFSEFVLPTQQFLQCLHVPRCTGRELLVVQMWSILQSTVIAWARVAQLTFFFLTRCKVFT